MQFGRGPKTATICIKTYRVPIKWPPPDTENDVVCLLSRLDSIKLRCIRQLTDNDNGNNHDKYFYLVAIVRRHF